MDANHDPNLVQVWGHGTPDWQGAFWIECPGTFCRCVVPRYYRTRHFNGRWICEDKRLDLAWRDRISFERWCRTRPDGTLEEPDEQDRMEAARSAVDRVSRNFAAAAAELRRRRKEIKREYLKLVELTGGEPYEEIFDDEVIYLVEQVQYALACYEERIRD